MSRLFYSKLARKLRQVDVHVTEKADKNRDAQEAEGAVSLADVHDFLTSNEGAKVVEAGALLSQEAIAFTNDRLTEAGVHSTMTVFDKGPREFYPPDQFDAKLVEFYDFQNGKFGPPRMDPRDVPSAITTALSQAAGRDGMLTEEKVAKLGPNALEFFYLLKAGLQEHPNVRSAQSSSKYEELGYIEQSKVARSRRFSPARARMPVLDEITHTLGGPEALSGFSMASVQHLFPSTRGLFEALVENGIDTASTGIGGKGYSTDMDAMMRLTAQGFDVHEQGRRLAHDPSANAEKVTGDMARSLLNRLFGETDPSETQPKFLLLDEGAKLIQALHLHFPEYAHLCVCVEQTDRGIQVIEEAERKYQANERGGFLLKSPVVNMARSDAKKVWESPMIGESCVANLEHALSSMHADLKADVFDNPERKKACVVGYGAVGQATAARLRARGFKVYVHDIDPEAMAQAKADGCEIGTLTESLAHGHLTYSCTGKGPIKPEHLDFLPDGAVLANAASGNHEFPVDALPSAEESVTAAGQAQDSFQGRTLALGEALDPMKHRVVQHGDKQFLLARSGYVVNMEVDIPPEYAQLIRGLLLASCLTAAKSDEAGLVDIPQAIQNFVVSRVQRALSKIDRSLEQPDFRDLSVPG